MKRKPKLKKYPDGGFIPLDPLNLVGYRRQILKNPDGSFSTESTIGITGEDGKYYNIPTVINGKRLSFKEAVDEFHKTGNHMGVFNTQEEADKSAEYREKANIGWGSTGLIKYKSGGVQLPKFSTGDVYGGNPYLSNIINPSDPNRSNNTGGSNAGMSNMDYVQAGVSGVKAAATIANTANNSELTDAQKKQQYAQATNQVVDTVGSMMFPWYGPAKKGEAMAKSIIGNHPDDPTNRALNALATPQHEQMIDDAIKGNYVDAVGDIAGAGFYAPIKAYFNKDTMYKHGGKHKPKINFINPQPGNTMYGTDQYPDGGKKKVDRNTQDVYSKWRNEFIKTHPDMNGRDLMEYYNKYVTPKLGIYDYSPTNPKRDTIYIDTNLSYMDNLINSSGDSTLIYKYNDRKNKDPYFKNMFEKKDSNEIINPNHFPDGGLYNPNNALSDINFQDWYSKNTPEGKRGIPFNIKNLDYDYYSYYKNEGAIPNIKGSHFTDKYKLPNHKTFSNESLYSTPENPGGFWNGEKYNKNGKFLYPFGGQSNTPNAEVERSENTMNPDGSTNQYNGPSHEQGGIPTQLYPGTLIFSDRLKLPGTKKTFADLNKKNNTDKVQKILDDENATSTAKSTAQLIKDLKNAKSLELFKAQEELKNFKISNYANKLGEEGVMYKDGGIHIKPSHKGRFTAYLKRTGSTLQEALHSKNPHVRQMANFARNAKHWKHANGGVQGLPKFEDGAIYPTPDGQPIQPEYSNSWLENPALFDPNYDQNSYVKSIPQVTTPESTSRIDGFYETNPVLKPSEPIYAYKDKLEYNPNMSQPDKPLTEIPINSNSFYKDPFASKMNTRQFPGTKPIQFNPNPVKPIALTKGKTNNFKLPENNKNLPDTHYDNSPKPNWWDKNGQYMKDASAGVAQAAPYLWSLNNNKFGKKYDTTTPYLTTPHLLSDRETLKDSESAYKTALYNSKQLGGPGTLAAMNNAYANKVMNDAKIREYFANQNAGILNQTDEFNIGQKNLARDLNMKSKARSEDQARLDMQGLSNTAANVNKDYNTNVQQENMIKYISSMYPDFTFDRRRGWFYNSKGEELKLKQ